MADKRSLWNEIVFKGRGSLFKITRGKSSWFVIRDALGRITRGVKGMPLDYIKKMSRTVDIKYKYNGIRQKLTVKVYNWNQHKELMKNVRLGKLPIPKNKTNIVDMMFDKFDYIKRQELLKIISG